LSIFASETCIAMSDISLHYIEKGSGEPLILLHGNGEDHRYFWHQTEFFSKDFRVIAPDTRGHGRTPKGEGPFTISRFADDLEDFMDGLGLDKAVLFGFSDGGNIALTFALRHPERVKALIVDGANIFPTGMKMRYFLPLVLTYCCQSLVSPLSAEAARKAALNRLMVKEPHISPEELRSLDMPALVMAGTDDMIKESHTRLIAASIPGAELALIPGDHFVANGNHAAVNAAVGAFLERVLTPTDVPAGR